LIEWPIKQPWSLWLRASSARQRTMLDHAFSQPLIVIIDIGCANVLLVDGARFLYAFARDCEPPFSSLISKVDPRHRIPVVAILLGQQHLLRHRHWITHRHRSSSRRLLPLICHAAAGPSYFLFQRDHKKVSGP